MKILMSLLILVTIYVTEGNAQNETVDIIPEGQISYHCPPCGCEYDQQYFESLGDCPACDMPLVAIYPGVESQMPVYKRLTAAILIFDHADIMDVTGPWSVFVHNNINVVTFAKSIEQVRIGMSMDLTPDYSLKDLPDVDILVFPGGGLAETAPADDEIISFIKSRYNTTEVLLSVCSGAFFLAESGLLDGKTATTFASLIPRLRKGYPQVNVVDSLKYTDNGKIITTAGLSSGIDGAFYVVSKFRGQGEAQDVANHMEYPWNQNADYVRTQLADNYISGLKDVVELFAKEYLNSSGNSDYWKYEYLLTDKISSSDFLKIIDKQLEETGRWKLHESSENVIAGDFNHDNLGEGTITIKIHQTDKGNVVSLHASRKGNY